MLEVYIKFTMHKSTMFLTNYVEILMFLCCNNSKMAVMVFSECDGGILFGPKLLFTLIQ
jgi:hypothetical protein